METKNLFYHAFLAAGLPDMLQEDAEKARFEWAVCVTFTSVVDRTGELQESSAEVWLQ